jgi:outer membrane protein assembly factor BamB
MPIQDFRIRANGATTLLAVAVALLFLLPTLPVGAASARSAAPTGTSPGSAPISPGDDYPTFLGNIERTSSSSESSIGPGNASALHRLWAYDAGGEGVQSQPVEQNGITYFGGRTGYEYAVDALNGSLLWQTYLGQDSNDSGCFGGLGVTSSATVIGPDLYVDGGYPYLYDLNATTGVIEWRALIGGSDNAGYYDWSSPLIYNGFAYVGISSDCDQPLVGAGVAKYSLSTHALVASFNSSVPELNGSSIWSSPSVNPATNTIFVTTGNAFTGYQSNYSESALALNASTLAVQATWQLPPQAVTVDGDFGVTPTLFAPNTTSPMLTAANKNGVLYAFDQSNLTLVWNRTICCQTHTQIEHISTAWGGGLIYAVGALTTLGSVVYNSSVWALDPLTGATVWVRGFSQSSQEGYAAPLWVNHLLIVPDQGSLLVLDANTGATLYQYTAAGLFESPASISRGEIFAASDNGHVYAFDVGLNSTATQSTPVGSAPLTDSFRVTPSGGLPPYRVAWAFGDGQTSNLTAPVHTYAVLGTYHVSVSVTDLAGNVSVRQLTVTVLPGFEVSFEEAGLPSGANWSVTLDGSLGYSTGTEIMFVEPNGSYPYEVLPRSGYSVAPSSGNVTVNGLALSVPVEFSSSANYLVTFTETGLPSGANWSVTVNGTVLGSTGSTITTMLADGIYSFLVSDTIGLVPSPSSGTVVVEGTPILQSVTFRATATCVSDCPPLMHSWFTATDETYLALGALVAVALVGLALVAWSRRKGRRIAPLTAAPGTVPVDPTPPPLP